MIKLIEFLVTGCWHKWETVDVCVLTGEGGLKGRRVVSKCKKCSSYKKQDLI